MTIFTLSLKDAKSQKCSFTIPLAQMTALNHDQLITDANLVANLALAVTTAAESGNQMTHSINQNPAYVRPTSGYANREAQVVFSLKGATTGKIYTSSLPAPDLDKWPFNTDGKELYNAPFSGLQADVQLLIDGLENHYKGIGEEAVTVESFRFVGRNL